MTRSNRRLGEAAGLGSVFVAVVLAIAVPPPMAAAQVQDKDQQKCINALNKGASKVAGAQAKLNQACVKNAAKGSEPDAGACIAADAAGKVGAASDKLIDSETKSCTAAPSFGKTPAADVAAAAAAEGAAVATDMFGADVQAAVVLSDDDSAKAKCQGAVLSGTEKLAAAYVKEFLACKKAGLKSGDIDSAAALAACFDTVASDPKGKLADASTAIRTTVLTTCAGLDTDELFPGTCEGFRPLNNCVAARARCRMCSLLKSADDLDMLCDRYDDSLIGNASCGDAPLITEHVTLPGAVEPEHTPGSPGVVVTNPKLITQFGGTGFDLNNASYTRWRLNGGNPSPDAILVVVPGFGAGVNTFRVMAEDLIPKVLAEHGLTLEVWGFQRRTEQLEDRAGSLLALDEQDGSIALDWYFGGALGLTLHPVLAAGPNRRAVFHNTSSDIPFLADFTPQVFSHDIDMVVEAALAAAPGNVFLGGHSAGTGFAARYAATDFNLSGVGAPDPGYAKLRGLVLFEGGGGTTAGGSALSEDTLDRIIAKADGGLFGAVRDNAARCVDETTPCTIATEATDCSGQIPPKCTTPVAAYAAVGGLTPEINASGEIGGIQGIKDPETGQVLIQVDQGSPGNNAVAQVPGLSLLGFVPAGTVEGIFGFFLDDDGLGAMLSTALATSLGAQGPLINGLATWIDIDGDGNIPGAATPNNGPAPTTLPAGLWGQEVEVTRMDRHRTSFVAGGDDLTDWYYAGSGLSVTSVSGQCSSGSCVVGNVGAMCSTNGECSQSISLDSSRLSVDRGRRDIANLTQAAAIDIPVISFGGSNGLTPVGASYLGFGQSIGVCTAPSCNGTARVVSATLPNPAFPTYGDVNGGYEVYINEGYAHVDIVSAEDTAQNQTLERLGAFLARNLQP